MSTQKKSNPIMVAQGILMVAIAIAPIATEYRPLAIPDGFWDWFGVGLSMFGAIFVFSSASALRKHFTIETAVKQHTKLVTKFPFNVSRNPMYVGGLLMCFSWSLLQRSILTFLFSLLLLIVLNMKIKIEEMNLKIVFGEDYRKYCAVVRRFI